jgi:tetratricopeptide (TPR) repeat protein
VLQAQDAPTPAPAASALSAPGAVLPALFERASQRLNSGDIAGAHLDFNLFLLFNPSYSQGYFGRALTAIAENDEPAAIADLTQALGFAPQTSAAYLGSLYALRGQVYQQSGALDSALADFDQAIANAPSGSNYANRGFVYSALGQYAQALPDLTEAIRQLPEQALLPLARYGVYEQLGETALAAADALRFAALSGAQQRSGGPLTDGEPSVVAVQPGDLYVFTFSGQRGQRVTIAAQARPGDAIDPLIVLLNPDNQPIAASDDTGSSLDAAIVRFPLPADGVYAIVMTHALGGDTGQVAVGIEFAAGS